MRLKRAKVTKEYTCLEVNLPSLFKMPAFISYLNDGMSHYDKPLMATWHTGGKPGETSDVFIVFDHGGGANANMPGWDIIVALCDAAGMEFGVVRITNFDESPGEETA